MTTRMWSCESWGGNIRSQSGFVLTSISSVDRRGHKLRPLRPEAGLVLRRSLTGGESRHPPQKVTLVLWQSTRYTRWGGVTFHRRPLACYLLLGCGSIILLMCFHFFGVFGWSAAWLNGLERRHAPLLPRTISFVHLGGGGAGCWSQGSLLLLIGLLQRWCLIYVGIWLVYIGVRRWAHVI